jgi:hypothetical protein
MSRNRNAHYTFCLALAALSPSLAHANGGQGMTWRKLSHDSKLGIDQVSCNNGMPGGCNAYQGETSCLLSRPVLCIKVDNSVRPGYVAVGSDFYDGWAGGHIATTFPVQGIALNTPDSGDGLCRDSFGAGWRMAEFHDNRIGGWGFRAYGNVREDQGFWVKINDQPANCWNP